MELLSLSMLCMCAGLPVKFNQREIRVAEGAGTVDIVVELTGNIHNLNSADLQLVEDPNESGCLVTGQ